MVPTTRTPEYILSSVLNETKYEKYIVEKKDAPENEEKYNYIVSRLNKAGEKKETFSDEESRKLLQSDFFRASILLCRNPEHNSILHKAILLIQKINSLLFKRKKKLYDYSLTHAAIVLGKGTKTKQYPIAPFAVAHADYPGIVKENYDFLADKDCTSLFLYRPTNKNMIKALDKYAHLTSYALKDSKNYPNKLPLRIKTRRAAEEKPRFNFAKGSVSIFWKSIFAPSGKKKKKPLREKLVRQTGFLVADLFLESHIKTKKEKVRHFICSGYAADVLGGTIMLLGLEKCSSKDIVSFCLDGKGKPLDRPALAKKISDAILKENPTDPVEKVLHDTYAHVKIARVQATGRILPIHLARELDKSVVDT